MSPDKSHDDYSVTAKDHYSHKSGGVHDIVRANLRSFAWLHYEHFSERG